MNRRKFILGMTGAAVGGSALLASGSFSRTESNREATVEVVGDEDAYVRLVFEDVTGDDAIECEGEVTLVTVTNQLRQPITGLDIDIEVVQETGDGDGIVVGDLDLPDLPIPVGASGEVGLVVENEPGDSGAATIRFDIEVRGGQGHASQEETVVGVHDRQIEVEVACPATDAADISWVAFCGGETAPVVDVQAVEFNGSSDPVTLSFERTGGDSIARILVSAGAGPRQQLLIFEADESDIGDTGQVTTRKQESVSEGPSILSENQVDSREEFDPGHPCSAVGDANGSGARFDWDGEAFVGTD